MSFQEIEEDGPGTRRVCLSTLMRICAALDCSATAILGGRNPGRTDEALSPANAPFSLEGLTEIRSVRVRHAILDLARDLGASDGPAAPEA